MIIDVSWLIKNETEQIIKTEEVDGFKVYDDVKALTPIKLFSQASFKHGLLNIDLDIAYTLELICCRCLKVFTKEQKLKFKEEYTIGQIQQTFEDEIIDSAVIAKEMIILNAPIKNLCKEDCLGLCAVCGKDKNENKCDCDDDKSNPYFDKLKILLCEKDKEV